MADWSDLRTRTISAIALGVGALLLTVLHPLTFAVMVIVGAAILWKEWFALTSKRGIAFWFIGIAYILAATLSLIYLRNHSLPILLALFAIVWGGDVAAYIAGKQYGKHKIAPSISPGKSWEGLAAAVAVSAAIGAILGYMAPIVHAFLGAALAVAGLLGDLFESSLKRKAGVKDSGTLIPGHGGLFDRVDSLLPCAILAALAFAARNGGF
jgi:phosphatidate cytidylyltransferase